ncbi:hypothetical protein [Marinobacter salarius]|uniref:hypothetical protein n=1 Tax=Marinobacter salarius TaxID=1420917 RepID=UPI0032EE30E0
MNRSTQILCIWSIPAFIISYTVCFVFVAGFVPPPSPTLSAAEMVTLFDENRFGIRAGLLLCMIFSILYMPWSAVVSVHMARLEGRFPVLASLQLVGAAILVVFFMLCSLIWIAAAFRPDIDPVTLVVLNDLSWLIFVMAFPEYWLQLLAIAVVFFRDTRPVPFIPRWACYFTLMVALTGAGGSLAAFFKSGPWAWDGLLGFWVPVISYLIWLIVMFPLLLRGVRQHAHERE